MKNHRTVTLGIIALCSLTIILAAPFFGMQHITPSEAFSSLGADSIEADIFWKIRIPRVLIAFLAGASLALSGMVFQGIFRNPLATPFTLGVSSGAAFGAAAWVKAGAALSAAGLIGRSFASFTGALASILLVYGLTRARKGFSTATMLLAGVAVSFFFASLILVVQYLSDFTHSFRIVRWLMGGLEIVGYGPVLVILPFTAAGTGLILFYTHELNLMLAGEDIAAGRGVNVKTVRTLLFFATSLMVGAVVATTGPIGFVGMMSPHICRLIIGHDHRFLTPAALLFGGAFLIFCDTVSRVIIAPAEIPVGIITALLGGPFFLWLLVGGTSERELM